MKKIERALVISTMQGALKKLEREQSGLRCANCIHAELERGRVKQCTKWGAVPPADVQNAGCDQHEDDDIPF